MAHPAQPPLSSTSTFSPSINRSEQRRCFYADPVSSVVPDGYLMHSCEAAACDAMQGMVDDVITAAVQSGLGHTERNCHNSPEDCYESAAHGIMLCTSAAAAHVADSRSIPHHTLTTTSSSILYSKYCSTQDYATAKHALCQHTVQNLPNVASVDQAPCHQQLLHLQHEQEAVAAARAAAEQQQQQQIMPLYGSYTRPTTVQYCSSAAAPGCYCHTGHCPASSFDLQHAQTDAARLLHCPTEAVSGHFQQQHRIAPDHIIHIPQQPEQQISAFATCSSSSGSAGTAFPALVYTQHMVGRWSGQVAVLETSSLAGVDEADDGNSGYSLECEEELLSLGAADASYQQCKGSHSVPNLAHANGRSVTEQGLKTHSCRVEVDAMLANDSVMLTHIEESGSSKGELPSFEQPPIDMEEDQECDACAAGNPRDQDQANAAAPAAQQHKAAQHHATMQALEIVAAKRDPQRTGNPVLSAIHSAAAGSESVRPRLLITEVSVYIRNAANSQMALNQANRLMGKMALPGNVEYMPVSPDSFLFKAGAAWQFPAFVICLGSGYLQCMLARLPQLAEAVLACPGFEDYAELLPEQPLVRPHRLCGPDAVVALATLRSVQFTCLYLATKVADQIHALGLLRFMLTNLSHNGAMVTIQQAASIEASCLEALDWRLGPFFFEDDLTDNDEEMWAESMGHFDYGTERDSYPETF